MSMLNNPWVIGIIGGLISSVLAYFVTLFISSKISKKEYLKKVDDANSEVIGLLKKVISEGEMPNKDIIDSIIQATSREYKINKDDMYEGSIIIEHLIKEVFETSFISINKKILLSELLLEVKNEYTANNEQISEQITTDELKIRDSSKSDASLVLSTLTISLSVLTLIITVIEINSQSAFLQVDNISLIPFISLVTMLMFIPVMMLLRIQKNRLKNIKKKETKNKRQ